MAGYIPDESIRAVLAATDMVSLVEQYLPLEKKSRANYFGLCPFHKEKTPSFSVSPEKQIFYCFGCHEGGNAIRFIEKIENLNFPDAVRFLAQRAGLEIAEEESEEDRRREASRKRQRAAMLEAARYFYHQLQGTGGEGVRRYLYEKRQLSADIVTRFGLGYGGSDWDGLCRFLQSKGYKEGDLLAAGLARRSERGPLVDLFRQRLIFPVFDVWGKIIAFGGRVMDDRQPKYLNSPESDLFSKRDHLFALNFAKKSERDDFILTEGYMDTIALHEAGFDSAVASLGTALTAQQAKLLAERGRRLVLSYDADAAGQRATDRAIEILRKTGVEIRVLVMPQAKDPDQFIHQFGKERFRSILDHALPVLDYRLLKARERSRSESGVLDRLLYQKEAIPILAAEENAVLRELYGKKLAEELGVSTSAIEEEIERRRKPKQDEKLPPPRKAPEAALHFSSSELALLAALLYDHSLVDAPELGLRKEDFRPSTRSFFDKTLERCHAGPLSFAELLQIADAQGNDPAFSRQLIPKLRSLRPKDQASVLQLARRALNSMRFEGARAELNDWLEQASKEKDPAKKQDFLDRASRAERHLDELGRENHE